MTEETLKYKQKFEEDEIAYKEYDNISNKYFEIKNNKDKYTEEEYWERLRLADEEKTKAFKKYYNIGIRE